VFHRAAQLAVFQGEKVPQISFNCCTALSNNFLHLLTRTTGFNASAA
jgi:hypothetical protein